MDGGGKMKRAFYAGAVLALLCLAPVLVPAVQVDYVSGEVLYRHLKQEWQEVEVGTNLLSGDTIETGMKSEAILLDEGSEIYISENSSFTVSERYEQETKRSTFMLFLGRMKFKLGASAASEPDIQTQTVNLTIRGTEFEVGSGYDGSTIVLIDEGSVAVQGKSRELLLNEGEGTEVPFGEEPTEKFQVMTRVIDWNAWLASSQDAVRGNETALLRSIRGRFDEISGDIAEYERIREAALQERDRYLAQRDDLLEEGRSEEAAEASKKAGRESKVAFHSLVNIRFLALSSIGLYDMTVRIYTGIDTPTTEQETLFSGIRATYNNIESRYVMEGDRERLEEQAERKKGCLNFL
jgi:hypothetical protein